MTDPVDTDALRSFGLQMLIAIPEHKYIADQMIDAANALSRLWPLIENAPHASFCQMSYLSTTSLARCTCWKAEAL